MNKLGVVVVVCGFAAVASAGPRPLLEGSYEVASLKMGNNKEIDWIDANTKALGAVWARNVWTFDGDKLTIMSQGLYREDGQYYACEATLATTVEWTKSGFRTLARVEAQARYTMFKKLTPTADDSSASTAARASTRSRPPSSAAQLPSSRSRAA